jgi:RNA polymerase sigma factor (sigma-70 family)
MQNQLAYKNLSGFAFGMTRRHNISVQDVEEILHEGVASALVDGLALDDPKVKGYIMIRIMRFNQLRYRAYRSKGLNSIKRPSTLQDASSVTVATQTPLQAVILAEATLALREAIATLSPRMAKIMNLHLSGLSTKQVAAAMGITPHSLAAARSKATNMLREIMVGKAPIF